MFSFDSFNCKQSKQVAQQWQRHCVSSNDDFKGWVHLRLNFRLKGYCSH